MNIIQRKDLPIDYEELMLLERDNDHPIIFNNQSLLVWQPDPFVVEFIKTTGFETILDGLSSNGVHKGHPLYRAMLRKMGCSLSSYWTAAYDDE
jgi:hypothetical protein